MSDIDTAEALLGDDDGEDYDLGQDEEAELLRDDDADEPVLSFQADPLDDEEDTDENHRDKFASERTQQEAREEQENQRTETREFTHRVSRGRGGRGRGRGGFFKNPLRIGQGKCYVNPSFLQGKKPVQSVQPSLYKQRNFEPKRRVLPFVQPRFPQQQPAQQQYQHLNNQAFVQPNQANQNVWQPPVQQAHSGNAGNQHFYDGIQQQQQCYQPPIQNTPNYPQQQPLHNQSQQYFEGPQNSPNCFPQNNPHYNNGNNSNFTPPFNAIQHQQQQPPQPLSYQQPSLNFQHQPINQTFNQPILHQPQQHVPQNNFNYNDQNHHNPPPQQTPIFNHPPQHQNNSGFTPRHSTPLLQRPVCFTHDQGQFHVQPSPTRYQPPPPIQTHQQQPQHNIQQQQQVGHQPYFNNSQSRQEYHHQNNQPANNQYRPRSYRPNFNVQHGQAQRGSYQGRHAYNNRYQQSQPVKRHYNWRDDQHVEDVPKRRSWQNDYTQRQNDYKEAEQETQEDYQEEVVQQEAEEDSQAQNTAVTYSEDPTPAFEEDEETRAYRLKIEEQKRQREAILAEKERKRKLAILKKTGQVSDIPALHTSPPAQQARPKQAPRLLAAANPNLRVLTRAEGERVTLLSTPLSAPLITPTLRVKIKPGAVPTKLADSGGVGDKPKLTAGFLSTRKVLAKDDALLDTPVVVVRNLAAASTETHLRKMCNGIGLLQSLELSPKERHAKIRFKSVASAHAFYKKYQRHMLDLSMIHVDLVAE